MEDARKSKKPNPILVTILIGLGALYVAVSSWMLSDLYERVVGMEHRMDHMSHMH